MFQVVRAHCRFCKKGSWSREVPRSYGELYRHYRVAHGESTDYSSRQVETALNNEVNRREDHPSSVWCPYGCGVRNYPKAVWRHTYSVHRWAVDEHSFPEVRWRPGSMSHGSEEMRSLVLARLMLQEAYGAQPPLDMSRRQVVVLGRGGVESGWCLDGDARLSPILEVHLELIRGQIPRGRTPFTYVVTDSG